MVRKPRNNPRKPAAHEERCPYSATAPLVLKLYIADNSPISLRAIGNLTDLLRTLSPACYQVEIIDGLADPMHAVHDGVLVTPTLLKIAPAPTVSLLGDLHDRQQVLRLLGIPEESAMSAEETPGEDDTK